MARPARPPRLHRIGNRVQISVQDIQDLLASDGGRRLRRVLAAGVIVGAPLIFRSPGLRRYPLLKALEVLGGAALIIKLAEALRDWEPGNPTPIVLEVPGHPRDRT
jgi:hypothetical protein